MCHGIGNSSLAGQHLLAAWRRLRVNRLVDHLAETQFERHAAQDVGVDVAESPAG